MTFWRSNVLEGHLGRFSLLLLASLLSACAHAGPAASESPSPRGAVLRVGTSGDYAPFSVSHDLAHKRGFSAEAPPTGFDPAVAVAYAADRGLAIEWVRFRWPDLLSDLADDRFDVAMSGVTVRPDRSLAARFSVPVCQSGALLLIDPQSFISRPADGLARAARGEIPHSLIDRPTIRIAVNAGGHLERVTRRHFPNATLITVPDNGAVLERVFAGDADAAATDTQEAPSWTRRAPSLAVWGPFTRDQKAYLVQRDRPELAADLDAWLQARELDGSLAELRRVHLQGRQPATAAGLPALIGGIAERLALMPFVAEAKRRSGGPIEVPEREARVIEAGILRTVQIARQRGLPAPDPVAVSAVFRAQIEAAKAIQRRVLADAATLEDPPDLGGELRPALIRIGDRLAGLMVGLQVDPGGASPDAIRKLTSDALAAQDLDPSYIDAIAVSIASLSRRHSAPDAADAP